MLHGVPPTHADILRRHPRTEQEMEEWRFDVQTVFRERYGCPIDVAREFARYYCRSMYTLRHAHQERVRIMQEMENMRAVILNTKAALRQSQREAHELASLFVVDQLDPDGIELPTETFIKKAFATFL